MENIMRTVVQTKSGNFVVVDGDRPVSRPYLNYCSISVKEKKKNYCKRENILWFYEKNFSEGYFEGYDSWTHDVGIKDPIGIEILNSGVLNS